MKKDAKAFSFGTADKAQRGNILNKNNNVKELILLPIFAILFGIWAHLVLSGKLESFDLAVQSFFFSLRNPIFNSIGVALEYIGHWPVPALVCVVMVALKKTRLSYGLPLTCCVLTSVGMYEFFKHIFKRPRPDASLWLCPEHGFSFPSGHTLNNTVFWVVFASLVGYYFLTKGKSLPVYARDRSTTVYPRKKSSSVIIRVLLIAWPLIIGMSRILVGVHWPSDVIGSLILSVAIISLGKLVFFFRNPKRKEYSQLLKEKK